MDNKGFDKDNVLSQNFLNEVIPFIFDLCNYWEKQPELLASPKQTMVLTNIRKSITYIYHNKFGIKTNTISIILNRNHSTIIKHLQDCDQVLANKFLDMELSIYLKKSLEFYNKNYND